MSIVRRVYMHMFEIAWCKKLGGFVTINTIHLWLNSVLCRHCWHLWGHRAPDVSYALTQQTLWRETKYHYVALMSMGARHTLNLARCSLQGSNISHQTDPNGKMKIIDSKVPLGWDKLIPRASNTTINAIMGGWCSLLSTWHMTSVDLTILRNISIDISRLTSAFFELQWMWIVKWCWLHSRQMYIYILLLLL